MRKFVVVGVVVVGVVVVVVVDKSHNMDGY